MKVLAQEVMGAGGFGGAALHRVVVGVFQFKKSPSQILLWGSYSQSFCATFQERPTTARRLIAFGGILLLKLWGRLGCLAAACCQHSSTPVAACVTAEIASLSTPE